MLHIAKKLRKTLLYAVLSLLVLGAAFSTFAQLSSDAYVVRTVHVFPSEISANGWENAETLTFQNLDEYALYQDFNAINSATLGSVRQVLDATKPQDEPESEEPLEIIEVEPEVVADLPASSTVPAVDEVPLEEVQEVADQEEQSVEEAETEDASVETEYLQETEEDLTPEAVETTILEEEEEEVSPDETATTTVLREVRSLFRLAIDSITEAVTSTPEVAQDVEEPEPEELEESVAEPEVSFGFVGDSATSSAEVDFDTTTTTVDELPELTVKTTTSTTPLAEEVAEVVESVDVATSTEPDIDVSTTTDPETVTAKAAEQPAVDPCTTDCSEHVLTLENFGYPLDDGVEISGAQLRMSFAAKHKDTREDIPALTMNYSFDDGESWSTGGSVVIDDEVSNSINGGYYLFALPAVNDPGQLSSLQVELRYDSDPALIDEVFVESVWLELFVLEPPQDPIEPMFGELLADDGFESSNLSGDILMVSETEQVAFTFTDDNSDETLIIKSDRKTYEGLSSATTYFSVSNTSNEQDEFALQTYFPDELGEVTDLQVFNVNKPREAIIPEYRPYIYHCEAGWSENIAEAVDVEQALNDFSIALSATTSTSTVLADTVKVASTTAVDLAETVEADDETTYSCRDTSVVRSCESVEGEGTACSVTEKVQEHTVTQYARGWDDVDFEGGDMGNGGLLDRAATFFGLAPQRKEVPDNFEGRVFTDQQFVIDPGETIYFKMDIAFPAFSSGEYWIEAVGDSEYGLLDPFWSSEWQYRMPFQVANPTGTDQTEFQVRLQLDGAINDFWDNIDSDGDDIRFVQEISTGNLISEAGPQFENTYDDAWADRLAITIDADNVDSLLVDFPVYVNLADLGPDFWAGVQSDGRDIRITEADGSTELPYDLVEIDTVSQTGELHFLASRIDSGIDTTFHMYFDNGSASAYGVGDTFGRNAVWAAYEAVYHFSEDPTTIGNTIVDHSGNGKDLVVENDALATTTGKLGTALDLTVSGTGILRDSDWQLVAGDEHVSSGWYQQTDNSAEAVWQWGTGAQPERAEYMPWYNNGTVAGRGYFRFGDNPNTTWDRTPYIDQWVHFTTVTGNAIGDPHLLYDDNILRIDTVQDTTDPFNNDPNGLQVGRYTTGGSYDGFIDELRFEFDDSRRTEAWVNAEYVNQSTTTSFYATSTQLTTGEVTTGWYATSWNQRVLFEIAPFAVEGTQTDFPVYLDMALLGSDFFAGVASDGSDIRVTLGDGKTEVPVEVVTIDTGAETGQLYFKATISGGEKFYVYFDNEDANAYARDAQYGSENVWTNGFQAVYHFEESAAGVGNPNVYLDSTANEYHGDDSTSDTDQTGAFGNGAGFGAGVADAIELPNDVLDGVGDHTVSWWHNTTQTTDASIVSAANPSQQNEFLLFFPTTAQINVYFNGPAEGFNLSDTVTTFNTGLWQHYMETGEDAIDEVNMYVNGRGDTENPDPQPLAPFSVPNGGLVVAQEQDAVNGAYDPNQRFIGQLDELRFATTVRNAGWAATEYANMEDPASFFSTSPAETLTTTEFVELDYWLQHFDYAGEEADVWVQVEDLPTTGATIYAYYGNASAPAGSDEMATFSYDSLTEVYYVVDDHGADSVNVTSLVDNNQVQLAGGTIESLNRGESVSITAGVDGDSGLSILGPVSAVVHGAGTDGGDMMVPISFATTTFAVPTNRNTNVWYAYAPFASTTVRVFEGASGTALDTINVDQGTSGTSNAQITVSNSGVDGDGAVITGTDPILVTHRATAPGDGLVAYPPTTDALYGVNSNFVHYSAVNASTDVTVTCSAGAGGTVNGITRGDHEADASCTAAAEGVGSAVRLSGQTGPLTALQQADSDGNETTVFWPEIEFGTRYALPRTGAYVAVVCAPRYGAVDVEMQDALGNTIESATCTPGVTTPGKAYFTNGTGSGDGDNFAAGTMVASTNGAPFYAIFEDVFDDQDEKNIQTAVQARKYGGDNPVFLSGQQQEANAPVYEQLSFAWYQNAVDLTPTSTWPIGGGEFVNEGDSIVGLGAVNDGDVMRLRMNAVVTNATATAGTEAFTLQYTSAPSEQCSLAASWSDIGQVGSTTAAFNGYNNPTIQDGTDLPSTLLASSTVAATYEERNFSDFNPTDIGVGAVGEWDWVIEANNVAVNTNYCFRMIRTVAGEEFATYTLYPELETVGPPNVPTLITFFDNEKTTTLTPTLTFVANDIAGDEINYEIQIDNDRDFSSVIVEEDSASNFLLFEEADGGPDKAPFVSGKVIRFNGTADLTATTTYWWRVRASDPAGSATSSAWSEPFSFTIDTTLETSEWYQDTTEQFETNEISFISASGGSVNGGNGNVTGTPVDFDDAVVGNAWGEAFWSDVETSGEIAVQVQFNNNGNWQPIPNSEIPGNNLGTSTSPINLLQLDTNVYNELRLVANFTGTGLSLNEWGIRWALRIETPILGDLFDNQQTADTLPVFDFVSTDPQGDSIEYEISFSTDRTFTTGSSTFNSATDPGFENALTNSTVSPFASGNQIEYTTQPGDAFTDGETYWWRARAKDVFPGGDVFSPWSEADAFTIISSTTRSTWMQTTDEQFDQGLLVGTQASSGSVQISTEVGEFGTVDLTGNTWVQIPTDRIYRNMVVIASSEFDFSFDDGDGRTARVRNKTSNSFEIKVDNHLNSLSGPTTVDYIVMEAGDWLIDDGGLGVRLLAGTEEGVTQKQVSTYADGVGQTVTFPTNFGAAPAAFVTISSNNDSDWVDAHVDGGTTRRTEVTAASMRVSLAIGNHTASIHTGPEDIDYVVVGTGSGSIDGSPFQSLNTPEDPRGFAGPLYEQPLTGFASAPAVTIVQNNAEEGGQGGFAFKDLQGTNDNTSLALSVAEIGVNADGHIDEVVSVLAFESADGIISRVNDGTLTGEIAGEDIIFSDGSGPKFDNFSWIDNLNGAGVITYQMQYLVSEGVYALIPDAELPGNSTGFTGTEIDLTSIDIGTYSTIRPFAELACVAGDCPEINLWKLEWSEGVDMSGTLQEYDRTTPVVSGSISASVNGGPVISGGVVGVGGLWTLPNVTAFAGDIVTVWVDGADESDEAVGAFIYDGLGDITGVKLYEQHLSFEADEVGGTITNQLLASYDNSDDEDIMFSADLFTGNLDMCAVGTCSDANIYIGPGQTYIPATSTAATIDTHDFINNGTIELDANTFNVSGSWSNNATSSTDVSTVNMVAAVGSETVTSTEDPLQFHNISFGGFGMATFTPSVGLDLSGDLIVATGTLVRGDNDIFVEGSITTTFGGTWSGTATTTFDGAGAKTWSDGNAISQNIGNVTIDGPSTIVTVTSDVAAYDIVIGSNDTLVGGSDNLISVGGDWENAGTFTAQTSTVEIAVDDRVYPPVIPGSADWYSDIAFDSRVPVVIDSGEVSGPLTNFPLYVDLATLGADFWGDVAPDGADIRVTSGDGQTELPYDLVEIDYLAQTGELHFLADAVSDSLDTTFYVYFDNPAASAYAVSSTYGRNAVWSGYEAVYHFTEDPTSVSNTVTDVTGNGRDLSVTVAGLATTTGQLGLGYDLTGTTGVLTDSDFLWTGGDALITSGWYFMSALSNEAFWEWGTNGDPNRMEFRPWYNTTGGLHYFGTTGGATYTINPRDNTNWHHFTTIGTPTIGEDNITYEDAIEVERVTQTIADPENTSVGLQVGRQNTTGDLDALIDEFRIATTTRNTDWIEAEYTNQFTPTVFYGTSTVEIYQPPVVIDEATHNITANGSAFYSLILNDATTTPAFTEPSVVTDCDFTIATGTVALPTGKLSVGCSFTNNGVFMHNNGEVEFDGAGVNTITLNGTEFLNAFYDVTFDGAGSWSFLDVNATTTNDFVINDGTVTYPSGDLTIGGAHTITGGGAFDANDGVVKFVSADGANITTNGSSFNDVVFGVGGEFEWYDAAWTARERVTIPAANLTETLTDFPVYIDLADFGTEFWSGVAADGADLRVTTGNGQTEVAYELVAIDTGAETGQLHFQADNLSDVTDTTFYIYYDNAGAETYTATSTYGRNNVWTNGYEAVFHLEESGTGALNDYIDSTGNGYDAQGGSGVVTDVPTQATGLLGSAQDFENDVPEDYIDLNTSMITGLEGANTKSVSAWANVESWTDAGGLWNVGGNAAQQWFTVRVNTTNQWVAEFNTSNQTFVAQPIGAWQHVALDYDGVAARNYVNGVNEDVSTRVLNTQDNNGYGTLIGRRATGNYFDGLIDEIRFSSTNRSVGWYEAEYLNQSDTAMFYASAPETLGVDASVFTLNENFTDVDGDLTIRGSQLVAPLDTLTIGGSATNNDGSFNANNATTTFDSNDLGETVAMGNSPFYNLSFDGVGGGWTTATNTVQNKATLVTGADFVQSPNTTLTVNGVFENSFAAASTTWTDSTLTLTGGDYEVTGRLDSGDDYANVEVSGDTDIVIWNSTIASSTINDTSSIYMPDYNGTDGLLRIYGDFDRSTSSEYWSYTTDFDGTDLTGGSERQATVEIAAGSTVIIANTSALQIDGTTATTTVSAISGSYSLIADGAAVDMTRFSITDTGINGFELRNGTVISQLTDGEFLIATGTAITVDAATIETQPSTIYTDVRFQAVSGTPVNVTLDGIPAGYWAFSAAVGDRAGESFDADDGDPGAIQWDDSNFAISVSGVVYDDDGVTPTSAPVCNGVTNVVTVVVDGGASYNAACDPSDGSYIVTGITYTGNPKIVTYIERSAADGTVVAGIMDQNNAGGTGNVITVERGAVVDNAVLVAIIGKDDDPAISPPVGWTPISTLGNTTGDQIFSGAWYRVVPDASIEPTSYTFTAADGGEGYSYWIGSLVNVDTSSPIDISEGWTKIQNDTSPQVPATTTTQGGTVVISSWFIDNDTSVEIDQPVDWNVGVINGLSANDNMNLNVMTRTYDSVATTDALSAQFVAGGRDPQVITMAFAPAATPSATGTMIAATVTQTPIGSTGNSFEDITLTDEASGAATVVGGGSIPVTVPTTANGDVLVAIVGREDDFSITPPAGWIEIDAQVEATDVDTSAGAWYRVVTDAASEPATYNFINDDAGTEEYAFWIGSYSNVDTASPIDVPAAWTKLTSAPGGLSTASSITTITDKTELIAAWFVIPELNVLMPSLPWETRVNDLQSGTSQRNLNVATKQQPFAGATGDVQISSVGGGDDSQTIQIALRPRLVSVADEIADMDLYQDRVIVRHEDLTPLSIADMTLFDNDNEDDLPFTASTSTSPDLLTVLDGAGLYVWDNKTFTPGGAVDLQGLGATNADGSLAVGPNGIFTANDSDALTIGGSLFVEAGGTFDGSSSTPTFTATNAGQQIGAAGSSTINFYDLAFTGVGGEWAVQTPIVVDQNIAADAGVIVGISDIEVVNGDFAGNGSVAMTGGTVQLNSDNTFGGTTPWQFSNLVLGDGTAGITTPAGNATTTVLDTFTITAGHFLDNGSMTLDLAGSGNVFVENGTFLEGTGTVRYSGLTPNILRTTYNNLVIDTESGLSVTATAPAIGLQVLGGLTVGALGTSTLDLNTADPLTAIGSDVYIGALGTINASDTGNLDVFGDWDNDGSFVANGGLVEFLKATGTVTVAAGDSAFGDVLVGGNSDFTFTESATSTGNFTIATSEFVLQNGETLSVGGEFNNNMDDFRTTWTGTVLRLNSGTAYVVNPKDDGDTYETIEVTAGTHPRFWNSDAVLIVTEAGSSLYSQDHSSVDGDLNIYGDFVNNSFDDHWSYETDFDGVAVTPRIANVQIEDGGSVRYTGGSLTALGSSTATTTIAAFGAGPYDLTLAGTSTIDMQYYSVRDIAAEGLVLTGTPVINDLSFGDFEVAIDSGSAITVGGGVISANPAQTYNNNRFATTTAISAFNVTATGTSVSAWRFVNVVGNLDGEAKDVDPGGDPGFVTWEDSAAIITVGGNVYQSDRTTASAVCDGVTENVRLGVAGLNFATTTCAAGTGAYTFPPIGFGLGDTLTVYIDGEAVQAATVTKDPISLIGDMDLYENHVIVRHESGAPQTIEAMAVYDSSDDADIPFTAVDGVVDTLTLPADFALVVWTNKDFEPGGDVTVAGGGAGASYDGLVELLDGADYIAANGQTHIVGGSLLTGTGALIASAESVFDFTSPSAGRVIDLNEAIMFDTTFSGSGDWAITDPTFTATNDVVISGGALTLPVGTTTIGGSFNNTAGSFDANGGLLYFTSEDAGNTVEFSASDANEVLFDGLGSWTFVDVNATTTDSFTVATGTVTLPSGTLTVADDFVIIDTITHNGGTVQLVGTAGGNVVTLNGNDLTSLTILAAGGDYTLTDPSAALLADLTLADGSFTVGTGTVSIGGSFDVSGGIYDNGSGTLLFNSADNGEFIDPGSNDLYNVVIAGAGEWDLVGSATTTNNLAITSAGAFTVASGARVYVGNVFTNTVGGAATTWTGTTLVLDGANEYEINVKATPTELYDILVLGENTDISSWNSSATTLTVPVSSSFYSQDNAGVDGDLYIYGDYHIGTTTEYWSADTDFDGVAIGVSRQANVFIASSSAVSLDGGVLEIIGTALASTSIQNQGVGTFDLIATNGTLDANFYNVTDLTSNGLDISGTTNVISLSNGYFTQVADNTNAITLVTAVINNNASLVVTNTGFNDGGFIGGANVSLNATTTNSWSFTGALGNLWGEAFDVDGTDDCSSVRWDDSSCLLTEQTNYRWRNDDGGEGTPDSEWFNTDWSSRQRVRVINDDAIAYTNTAVQIPVLFDADMQSDFEDLRFTDSDGTTLVDHWIERFDSGSEAVVWIEAPVLATSTVSEFYMYYGNVTASSTSDGSAVFVVIEDFEDDDLSEYAGGTGDLARFETESALDNGAAAYGGGVALRAVNTSDKTTDGIIRDDVTVSQGQTIRFMQYIDTTAGSGDEACTIFAANGAVTSNQNYAICTDQIGTDRISIVRDVENTEFSGTILGTADAEFTNASFGSGWYEFYVDWETDNTIDVAVYYEATGALVATTTATDATYTSGGIGFAYWFQNGGWDSYVAYPRTENIPTVFLGEEQSDGGASWANPQNTPTGGFATGQTARLRLAIENSGLPIEDQLFRLEFAPKLSAPTCEAVAGVDYVEVPNIASCGSSDVCMATSLNISDGDSTTDHLLTTAGDFESGEVITSPNNQTTLFDLGQDRYTELEYAVQLTVNANNDSYCFRVTDDGESLDSYSNLPELTLAFDPIISSVTLNDGLDISLTPGTTTAIIASSTVTDFNGFGDLGSATTTFYKTSAGAACTPDDNNCYIATSSCSFVNCSGNSCSLICEVPFAYHTDSTDADGSQEWFAFMEVSDVSGASTFDTSIGVDVFTMRALDVQNAIAYGTVDISENTGSFNPSVSLVNLGNEALDVQIAGTDMTNGVTSIIPAAQQLYATSTFDYASCVGCSVLTVTGDNVEVDLDKPLASTPAISDQIYWGIEVPFGTASAAHTGINFFTAIAD